ncbi:unnamed protein product, partial [Mesorhabditis spiculigera]
MEDDLQESGFKLKLVDEDLTRLQAEIPGVAGSPYEGGRFELEICVPSDYPFAAPRARFIKNVWHPNVCSHTGEVGCFGLEDEWRPNITMATLLVMIQALLSKPVVLQDLQDAVVATQYDTNRQLFEETARFWTQEFAGACGERNLYMVAKVDRLCELGAGRVEAITALSRFNWNLKRATNDILG